MNHPRLGLVIALVVAGPHIGLAQTFPTADPVLRRIYAEGMDSSALYSTSQVLLDSIYSRLTGSPTGLAAHDWAQKRLASLGIPARNEKYGTWRGWKRGVSHLDLLQPFVRSLEATQLAWSPATRGEVEGSLTILPDIQQPGDFDRWLGEVRGKFALISYAEESCRPLDNWERFARPATLERHKRERATGLANWQQRLDKTGVLPRDVPRRIEDAGAIGIITSRWSEGWGVNKVFYARSEKVPTFDVSCEDYGLIYRLAANRQSPMLRMRAESQETGEQSALNTVAELKGRTGEYVVVTAHLDSWDGANAAMDDGAGALAVLEMMRIVKKAYPNPRRTIVAVLVGGEEQGLNGSRAFVTDHFDLVKQTHVAFNLDHGTGRPETFSMMGFVGAGARFAGWLGKMPAELSGEIKLENPGLPARGGTDHASFVCLGVPAFNFNNVHWDTRTYTWHTQRDTFDKIVFDDFKEQATVAAMLAYLASEDPDPISREQRLLPPDTIAGRTTGLPGKWPVCQQPLRSWAEFQR